MEEDQLLENCKNDYQSVLIKLKNTALGIETGEIDAIVEEMVQIYKKYKNMGPQYIKIISHFALIAAPYDHPEAKSMIIDYLSYNPDHPGALYWLAKFKFNELDLLGAYRALTSATFSMQIIDNKVYKHGQEPFNYSVERIEIHDFKISIEILINEKLDYTEESITKILQSPEFEKTKREFIKNYYGFATKEERVNTENQEKSVPEASQPDAIQAIEEEEEKYINPEPEEIVEIPAPKKKRTSKKREK